MKTKSKHRARSGFTLIEILVVMAIVMGLVSVVGVNVIRHQREARVKTATIQIRELQNAIAHYETEQGRIPTMEQGLEALVQKPVSSPVPERYPPDGYLASRRLPKDPWGNDYIYVAPGREGLPFEIISYGADGESGGSGDAADISSADF
jgi:general secretion pathway protein G